MFRKHLLHNLFQPTQISEFPESESEWFPDHSVANREQKERKKKNHIPLKDKTNRQTK